MLPTHAGSLLTSELSFFVNSMRELEENDDYSGYYGKIDFIMSKFLSPLFGLFSLTLPYLLIRFRRVQ
jgi:hypothetical protein